MEQLFGFAVVAYLIYSFISAIAQKQQRPDIEEPSDDAPWPHLENAEDPYPADVSPGEPARPDPSGPGPVFWPDLFGDPTQTGSPLGWPTEVPEQTEQPRHQEPQRAVGSKDASERQVTSMGSAGEAQMSSALAQAETDLLRRLAERERESGATPRAMVAAAETRVRRAGEQEPFELTPASLRQAILYTEVLGPPRALCPYRPPMWK